MASDILGSVGAASSGTATASPARGRATDMSEQFMTLLVAQMQNQDPLNPMDNSQVTSQIAQINTVSGINDLNDSLANINSQIDTSQQLQASALIGRGVLVPGDGISVGEEGAATPFGMELDGPASSVKLTITDSIGTVVHESSYADQPAGVQSFSWDGQDAAGAIVGAGSYRVTVAATGPDGEPVAVKPLSMGYVGGVVSGSDGPQLDLGPNGLVSLDEVRQII
ncbi:flagellar hook capping protein [Salinisphaera dokdonensis CL-ES53]|uniref:Basal-body rod modification protein FlgD n=1 Tax=Salinisphaera dokdonensis CL-ES53 TaxID=1304272 RepID=A0ABV2AYC1_9GAMM